MKTIEIPDNYRGMVADRKGQYWSFGNGYYRKHNGTVVYKGGKRVLDLARPGAKDELKKLLGSTAPHGTEKQLNLF